jgi:class 3 adenylate cyclase
MDLVADRDPEEARKLLHPVLEHMMAAVHRSERTVNQVRGDGIMALLGAPLAHEDDAIRAVRAAQAIQAQAVTLAGISGVSCGISQGIMRTGAYGGTDRRTYGVLGEATNLAARLMQAALDLCDGPLQARRVDLSVYTDNHSAISLYQKMGFSIEGRLRCNAFRDGHYVDSFSMARIR